MLNYLRRRLFHAIPVVFGVSLITFLLIRLAPGDPVRMMLGNVATPQAIAHWRAYFHLDDPLPLQYFSFLWQMLSFDFGESILLHAPVRDLLLSHLGPSAVLVVYSIAIALCLAVPLAAYSAVRANRPGDNVVKLLMMVAFAMPTFWLGLVLVEIFSLRFHVFPASGLRQGPLGVLWSLTLPAVTIGLGLSAVLIRTLRSAMIEALRADHVLAATARGLSPLRVLGRYVLRNSLIATVTVLGVSLGGLIGGSIIVENVFAIPGIGTLLVGAVGSRDFPVVQACALLVGTSVVIISILTDLTTAFLDPRSRLT